MTTDQRLRATLRACNRATARVAAGLLIVLAGSGLAVIGQEVDTALQGGPGASHAECLFFSPEGVQYRPDRRDAFAAGKLTAEISARLARRPIETKVVAGGSRTSDFQNVNYTGVIDREIFGALAKAGVAPAVKTSDIEFLRRVTLDLTGRIPRPERVLAFANDARADKRAALVDELLASPEFVDKWTVYFGDLLQNNSRNTQVVRFAEGRDAFNNWIRESLASDKPYNKMVTELISATGANSYERGELNWMVGGFVTGSPRGGLDIYDQQAANLAKMFLGISHMNCILCHDGRRHLDTLSVWGKQETRYESWQLAAFFAKSPVTRTPVTAGNNNIYYWSVLENPRSPDYPLNTTTGNRPARQPLGTVANVAPEYPFTGEKPSPNEPYRAALARFLTNDPQFARATVNYLWKEFFGRGIVDPVDQFDLMRLQTATLPAPNPDAPRLSTLQPSHPALLEGLAKEFSEGGFNLKQLIRTMVLSEAYQLSSRYEGAWKPEYEALFARKLVRRLWGEEILDSIVQVSNVPLAHNVAVNVSVPWAMQLPEPSGMPRNAGISSFLDSFYRGNRDNEPRRPDASIAQTLNLMNDPLVYQRARATGTGASASLARVLLNTYTQPASNRDLVQAMFLSVLSRPATPTELEPALGRLGALTGNPRQQAVEDLLWSLYNKVDFLYNY